LFQLLAEPLAALQGRLPHPGWLKSLAQAIGQSPPSRDETLPIPGATTPGAAFFPILQPLLLHAHHRLLLLIEEVSQSSGDLPVEAPLVVSSLLTVLSQRLLSQASKTLALELKVAGTLSQLSGQTPEARFHSFVRRLCQREALVAFLEEYSVLARQLVLTCAPG
jgi:hypothetical protein